MRILHLVSYSLYSGPLPPTVGLALAQRQLGHEAWMAYDVKRGAFNDYEEAAAPRLSGSGLEPPWALTLSAKSSLAEFWHDRRMLHQVVATHAVDVVHVHLSHDHLLAALALPRTRTAICVRTVHAERSLARRWGQAYLHKRVDAWITRAAVHRQQLMVTFAAPAERVAVIPSGFSMASWSRATPARRAELRQRFAIPNDACVVAQVALIANRGQQELVSALASLPPAVRPIALFVGRGETKTALREHIASTSMEPWVRFAGYLKDEALRDAYQVADLCFLAQPGNDGAARAALEAMAADVPLVAVAVGAIAELVADERGYPLRSHIPADIAAGVLAAARDAHRSERAARARQYVMEQRSFAQEAHATCALYDSVIKVRQSPRPGVG